MAALTRIAEHFLSVRGHRRAAVVDVADRPDGSSVPLAVHLNSTHDTRMKYRSGNRTDGTGDTAEPYRTAVLSVRMCQDGTA